MEKPNDSVLRVDQHTISQNSNESSSSQANIRIQVGDNYVAVVGQGADSHVNESIQFSDPDFETKLAALYEQVSTAQRTRLKNFVDNTLAGFDTQDAEMNEAITEISTYVNSL